MVTHQNNTSDLKYHQKNCTLNDVLPHLDWDYRITTRVELEAT